MVTGRVKGAPATIWDYDLLFRTVERPHKFSDIEVGYVEHGPENFHCRDCRHYFVGIHRTVCEIMRLPLERNIPAYSACRFWNNDGKHFPLIGGA